MRFPFLLALATLLASALAHAEDHIVRLDPALDEVLAESAEIRYLADGFTWAEGPAWDRQRNRLYFSDVPENKAYMWSETRGLEVFLDPSGHPEKNPEGFREAGTNGLLYAPDGSLLIANHGARAVERMDLATGQRETVIDRFEGHRLNSPNDLAVGPDGTLYFTDPPYGLAGIEKSPLKELPHHGVYAVAPSTPATLVDARLSLPNGLAVSPDGAFLYVAVSDPASPIIYRYEKVDGRFTHRQTFFDASPYLAKGWPGLPDGMAVTASGHLFATGPGGIFVLAPSGKLLGMIRLDSATANCAFGQDGRTLFITSGDRLLAVPTIATGTGWHD
ncbi:MULTISPECIES: SMP-30/gluconolactonase/LRE family protein [Kordiimonas]|jgi:gluconolactonase|uniref:SMP-30/gluconolactonase/LRE family protein n=1 Tax=Kordiimonas TaxID=288021 RepID=UPI00258082AB|nr:SMP-30/gluconolactonase/LRE family protein [Kordiimonas sp. UBA4487]